MPSKASNSFISRLIQSGIDARAAEAQLPPDRRVHAGHIVSTPGEAKPYKAVLQYAEGENTEHPFETMRAGEAFIRSESPMPPKHPKGRQSDAR